MAWEIVKTIAYEKPVLLLCMCIKLYIKLKKKD